MRCCARVCHPDPKIETSLEKELAAREAEYEPTLYRGAQSKVNLSSCKSCSVSVPDDTQRARCDDRIALPVSSSRGTGFCMVASADALPRQITRPKAEVSDGGHNRHFDRRFYGCST